MYALRTLSWIYKTCPKTSEDPDLNSIIEPRRTISPFQEVGIDLSYLPPDRHLLQHCIEHVKNGYHRYIESSGARNTSTFIATCAKPSPRLLNLPPRNHTTYSQSERLQHAIVRGRQSRDTMAENRKVLASLPRS